MHLSQLRPLPHLQVVIKQVRVMIQLDAEDSRHHEHRGQSLAGSFSTMCLIRTAEPIAKFFL